jgi:hypothetical protein
MAVLGDQMMYPFLIRATELVYHRRGGWRVHANEQAWDCDHVGVIGWVRHLKRTVNPIHTIIDQWCHV